MLGLGHAKPGWGSSGDCYFQVSRFVWVQDSGWLSGHPHSWATSVFCCLGLVSCLKAQAGCCGSGFYQEIAGVIQYSLKHWPVKTAWQHAASIKLSPICTQYLWRSARVSCSCATGFWQHNNMWKRFWKHSNCTQSLVQATVFWPLLVKDSD